MTYALELEQLTKNYAGGVQVNYAGGVQVLKGIDLNVETGDFYALFISHNGAGKFTIISIISALVNKIAGKVQVFGYNTDKDIVNVKR